MDPILYAELNLIRALLEATGVSGFERAKGPTGPWIGIVCWPNNAMQLTVRIVERNFYYFLKLFHRDSDPQVIPYLDRQAVVDAVIQHFRASPSN
jgi:hypothetical protein